MAKQIPLKLYIRCVCEGKTTADYGKSNDHFAQLGHRLSTALANADKLMKYWKEEEAPIWLRNPYTDVHQLMNKLDELSKKTGF